MHCRAGDHACLSHKFGPVFELNTNLFKDREVGRHVLARPPPPPAAHPSSTSPHPRPCEPRISRLPMDAENIEPQSLTNANFLAACPAPPYNSIPMSLVPPSLSPRCEEPAPPLRARPRIPESARPMTRRSIRSSPRHEGVRGEPRMPVPCPWASHLLSARRTPRQLEPLKFGSGTPRPHSSPPMLQPFRFRATRVGRLRPTRLAPASPLKLRTMRSDLDELLTAPRSPELHTSTELDGLDGFVALSLSCSSPALKCSKAGISPRSTIRKPSRPTSGTSSAVRRSMHAAAAERRARRIAKEAAEQRE